MLVAGLGEVQVGQGPRYVLACLGLGSCVGVSVYDPVTRVGGMAHIVLPESPPDASGKVGRYADLGVPLLLREVEALGACPSRLVAKMAGGAQIAMGSGVRDLFAIGSRNAAAVRAALERAGVYLAAADIGGNRGRSLRLYLDSGLVVVSVAGGASKEL